MNRITLHECRHTFASLMIAAGVNAKALSTFMGHATIAVTLDTYGHLMPGSEARLRDARQLPIRPEGRCGRGSSSRVIGADWRTDWRTGQI